MCENLINLIKHEINGYEIQIKNLNKRLLEYKPVYEALKPKGRNFKKENVLRLTENKVLLDKLTEIMEQINLVAIEQMLRNKILFEEHDSEVNLVLQSYGLSKKIIFSDEFLNSLAIKSRANNRLKEVYDKLIMMKERDDKLFKLNEEIVLYVCGSMIDLYENLLKEKENVKDDKKVLEYALKNIQSNSKLTPRDISSITLLLSKIANEEEKNKLSTELNEYLLSLKPNDLPTLSVHKEEEEKGNPKIYVDDNLDPIKEDDVDEDDEETTNYLAKNYLMALNFFDSYKDINLFLDSVKYDCDIDKILLRIINLLGLTEKEKLLKNYLLTYLENLKNEPVKDVNGEQNVLLYYGFLEKKNKVYSDILKGNIPSEYYVDVLKGLEMIKNNDPKTKVSSITTIKKVFKVRINDIRITYKKLSENVFIILGVFCKKDHKGYHVISKTKERNESLCYLESTILKAAEIPDLWDEYLKINNEFAENIVNLLMTKRK